MELKQGYKQTEVGVIPEDWELVTFNEISEKIIGGGTPSRTNKNYWGNEIPWVTVKDFATFSPLFAQESITKVGLKNSASHLIPRGTLITSTRMALGKAVIYKVDVAINQDLKAIFPKNTLVANFLFYWFQKNSKKIEELGSGSTVMGLSLVDLKKIPFTLPPIHEQTAIANALSDMDALISQTEKLIEKKKAIKQGAMQELLNPKEGWVTKKFTDVVNYIHGKAHEQFIVENGKFEVVNSKFISTDGKVKKYSDQSFLTAKKGDVLTVLSDLPNGKALAKCFYVEHDNKYAVNQRICIWRSINNYPKFLFYLLNRHEYFMALNDGVSQTHILNGHIEKFYIRIPENYLEQQSIAETLWDIDQELQLMETKLTKLKQQKQGMMQTLLTGKIRLVT
jgi:type I restriction enzyme S subunit